MILNFFFNFLLAHFRKFSPSYSEVAWIKINKHFLRPLFCFRLIHFNCLWLVDKLNFTFKVDSLVFSKQLFFFRYINEKCFQSKSKLQETAIAVTKQKYKHFLFFKELYSVIIYHNNSFFSTLQLFFFIFFETTTSFSWFVSWINFTTEISMMSSESSLILGLKKS